MTRLTHGMSKTKIYGIWASMRNRCENPECGSFSNYGGRGITVCERWNDFQNFYDDMGDRPRGKSLERLDNNAGYSPANCFWADRRTQNLNQRGRRTIAAAGRSAFIVQWAEISGLSVSTIWARLNAGWPEDRAVLTPKVTARKGIRRGARLWSEPERLAA